MKVGTDGVLVGAWAAIDDLTPNHRVLDLGTGTGLIALMTAQRCPARVWGLDIDAGAARQAEVNFSNSPWPDRLEVIHGDFRQVGVLQGRRFDHIISNPPFFSRSLNAPDRRRNLARHDETLALTDVCKRLPSILSPHGRVSMILPADRFSEAHRLFSLAGYYLHRSTMVFSKSPSTPIRVLAEWGEDPQEPERSSLPLYAESGQEWSQQYRSLTKEFYPAF